MTKAVNTETTTQLGAVKRVLALSYPLIVANLSQIVLGLVDTAMISRVSTEALAAAAVAASVNIAASMLFGGWATAAQVIAARRFGEGRQAAVGQLLDISLLVGVGAGIVVLLFLSIGAGPLLAAFGLSEAVRAEGVPYLRILALAAPLAAVTAMLRAVYAGVGETGVAMRMTLLVNVINIPLNYVLIFVVGWGLMGAGIGTVIAVAVGCAYMGQFGWRRFRDTYELFGFRRLRHHRQVLPRLWSDRLARDGHALPGLRQQRPRALDCRRTGDHRHRRGCRSSRMCSRCSGRWCGRSRVACRSSSDRALAAAMSAPWR